jgi:PAS domain S-box-containing protein
MAKMTSMSPLFKKTFLLSLYLFGIVALLASGLAAYILHDHMTGEFRSKGRAIAISIAEASQEVLLNRDPAVLQGTIDHYLDIGGVAYIYVRNSEGSIVAHTFVPRIPRTLPVLEVPSPIATERSARVPGYGDIMEETAPILEGVGGTVFVGMDKGLIESFFWKAVLRMQGLMAVIFVCCVCVLYYLVRSFSTPLNTLTEYAQQLARHDFSANIEIDSRDEIGLLARTMQSMAHELSALFNEMDAEVKKATGELRKNLSHQRAIINNLADGLVVIDPDGMVTMVNPSLCDYFGLVPADCLNHRFDTVFSGQFAKLMEDLHTGQGVVTSAEGPLSHGRIGKAVGSPVRMAESGMFLGGVVLVRDITPEKELDRLKTEFISTVSHELRTPMTSILGFSKIIRKKLEDDIFPALGPSRNSLSRVVRRVESNMDIIVSEAERLTEMINDVLDIAKMESGGVQWGKERLSMGEVVRQAVRTIRGMSSEKNLRFSLEVEEGVPLVRGDRNRLIQVLVNLLSNAVKFTESGTIRCHVGFRNNMVLTSVEDPGIGIDPRELPQVFEKFRQVGDTLTDKPSGTGLGLPICRQIVMHHGGDIWVESELGKGSIFRFTLPVEDMETRMVEPFEEHDVLSHVPCEDEADIRARSGKAMLVEPRGDEAAPLILVVDDDSALSDYLSQLFRDEGYRVLTAPDGRAAVDTAKQHLPNLITMDLMMPGMDGETAIRCLRSNPYTSHIPILVVSALSDSGVKGSDAMMLKPVDQEKLLEMVDALLRDRDMVRSCIVVGDSFSSAGQKLTVVNPERIRFCPPEDVVQTVAAGFTGFVFISNDLVARVDLTALSSQQGVQVVILPEVRI